MAPFSLHTPQKIAQRLAERLQALRLARGFKQATLAERAGVSLGALRRFEQKGEGSLDLVLRIAFVLDRLDDFADILEPEPAQTLAELEARLQQTTPKRGRL